MSRSATSSARHVGALVGYQILPRSALARVSPWSARCAWMVAITCAPSPTAAAQRFVEPARTSPIAKMPSRLVSSGRRPRTTSLPVRMNPFSSRATSEDKSLGVFGSAPMNENGCGWSRLLPGGSLPVDRLERSVGAFELAHRRLRQHLDVRVPADAIDEVARHGRVEARAARDQPDLRHLAREVDDRLSRGVAGADQGDLLPGAQLRLRRRRPVVDAPTLELRRDSRGEGGGTWRRSRLPRNARARARRSRGRPGSDRRRHSSGIAGGRPHPGSPSRLRTSAPGCRRAA